MTNNIVCVLGVYLLSLLAGQKGVQWFKSISKGDTAKRRHGLKADIMITGKGALGDIYYKNKCSVTQETVNGGSYCTYYIITYSDVGGSYCNIGCCSYTTYSPCCSDFDKYYYYDFYHSSAVSGGAVAGIVIGSLVGMGAFITVIICVCNAHLRSIAYGGQVVTSTNPGATVSDISTSNGTVTHVQPNLQLYGQPYTQPYGGQVNGASAVSQTMPEYSKGNTSAPPPSYTSVVNDHGHQATANVQSSYPTQSNQTTSHYSDLTPHSNGSEHNYSTITENNTPSAPSAENTD